jgi:hypothetical protein
MIIVESFWAWRSTSRPALAASRGHVSAPLQLLLAGGVFAIGGNSLIINPSGPGVGGAGGTSNRSPSSRPAEEP